jgi:hypothetical protein
MTAGVDLAGYLAIRRKLQETMCMSGAGLDRMPISIDLHCMHEARRIRIISMQVARAWRIVHRAA